MAAGKFDILFADLDGTLIFSAKRRQDGDIIIERKDGEPISCVTARQAELFPRLVNVIPVTTRSVEQYRRIEFARLGFVPKYALCDNGGTLLVDGEPDGEWARWPAEIFAECEAELSRYRELLERDPRRSFEVRLVDGLFLFTKSSKPPETLEYLGNIGNRELCESFATGEKVYVVPKNLNKGAAVKRLAARLGLSEFAAAATRCCEAAAQGGNRTLPRIAAAGDSLMDVPMLNAAHTAIFTENIPAELVTARKTIIRPRAGFTEFVTETAAGITNN